MSELTRGQVLEQCVGMMRLMHAPNDQWREGRNHIEDRQKCGCLSCSLYRLYWGVFKNWPSVLCMRVAERAVDTLKFRPSRSELLDLAADLESPTPEADEAWVEVDAAMRNPLAGEWRLVRQGGSGECDTWAEIQRAGREPEWSHPLIKATVRAMGGWQALKSNDRQDILRAQFQRKHEEMRERWRGQVKQYLGVLPEKRPPHLFPIWHKPDLFAPVPERKRLPAPVQAEGKPMPAHVRKQFRTAMKAIEDRMATITPAKPKEKRNA